MDFTLTDDQVLLRDSAQALLAKECTPALLRAHMDEPAASDALWRHLREWSALGVGPLADLCVAQEELGAVAAPGPFLATAVLAAPLLEAVGAPELDDVVSGATTATVALAGPDGWWAPTSEPRKHWVPEADAADLVLAVDGDGAVTVHERPPVTLVPTVDSTRRLFTVDVSGRGRARGQLHASALAAWHERATVAVAAELAGTARTLLAWSVAYAKERVQFDVPIGSFQAIQHKLADLSLEVERATAAVYAAAMAVDAGSGDRRRAAHVAKAAAGEAAHRAAKDSIQVHGGIGYTWEHDLHLFIRRAIATEAFFGTTGQHHDALATTLLG